MLTILAGFINIMLNTEAFLINWVNQFPDERCVLANTATDLGDGYIYYSIVQAIAKNNRKVAKFDDIKSYCETMEEKTHNLSRVISLLQLLNILPYDAYINPDEISKSKEMRLDLLKLLREIQKKEENRIKKAYKQQTTADLAESNLVNGKRHQTDNQLSRARSQGSRIDNRVSPLKYKWFENSFQESLKAETQKLLESSDIKITTKGKREIFHWLVKINVLQSISSGLIDKLHIICRNGKIFFDIVSYFDKNAKLTGFIEKTKTLKDNFINFKKLKHYFDSRSPVLGSKFLNHECFTKLFLGHEDIFWNLLNDFKLYFDNFPRRPIQYCDLKDRSKARHVIKHMEEYVIPSGCNDANKDKQTEEDLNSDINKRFPLESTLGYTDIHKNKLNPADAPENDERLCLTQKPKLDVTKPDKNQLSATAAPRDHSNSKERNAKFDKQSLYRNSRSKTAKLSQNIMPNYNRKQLQPTKGTNEKKPITKASNEEPNVKKITNQLPLISNILKELKLNVNLTDAIKQPISKNVIINGELLLKVVHKLFDIKPKIRIAEQMNIQDIRANYQNINWDLMAFVPLKMTEDFNRNIVKLMKGNYDILFDYIHRLYDIRYAKDTVKKAEMAKPKRINSNERIKSHLTRRR